MLKTLKESEMTPFFVLLDFISYLEIEKRYSKHTCVAYKKDLDGFLTSMLIETMEDLVSIKHSSVRSWMQELSEEGNSNKTINRKISALRSFFKWLRKQGTIDGNPLQKIKAPKVEKRLPNFVKESQLKREEEVVIFADDFEGKRDQLMIEMFYQTGIRLSELIGLKNEDVQAEHIKVLGKRNKERMIPISRELFEAVCAYRIERDKKVKNTPEFFVLESGFKLYPKLVYRKINNYLGKVTDLDKRSPHVLRHTFATHMLNNGAGLETLKELLGHANLSATQVYTHNSFTQLSSIYSQAHPRGRKTS
ncbi:MAG: tyrosine-type recombinase/integrase [Crocinitomicaceae bacterium]|jgi:integrase/recombinase XerC|nr:tyrosine-type recombinase/integrase [Crocinitomicaceae bacterium]